MKQTPEEKLNKTIINYSAKTLLVLIVLSLVGSLAYTFINPKRVATFAYNRGWKVVAEHYYIKEYEKNDNIDNLYNAVIISATNSSHKKVIKHYEKLSDEKGYKSLINSVNKKTEQLIVYYPNNINTLSLLLNEDNYLKNKYISALVATNNLNKALNYAVENSSETQNTLIAQNNYLFANLISETVLSVESVRTIFTEKAEGSTSVIEKINDKFENFYDIIIESNQEFKDEQPTIIEEAYLVKAKHTLKQIAHSLTEFNKYYEINKILHNQNILNLEQIEGKLASAIGS